MGKSLLHENILVIGGTGYVGKAVIRSLLQHGFHPLVFARKGSEKKIPEELLRQIELISGNIENLSDFTDILKTKHIYAVIYLLGLIRENPGKRMRFYTYHYVYMKKTLEIMAKAGVSRFIYMSANGSKLHGTPYQKTKNIAERFLKKSSVDWTIIKPSIIIGKDPATNFMTLIDMMLKLHFLLVFGNGDYTVSPVDREDTAELIAKCLLNRDSIRKEYTVCGPDTITFNQFIHTCRRLSHTHAFVIHLPVLFARVFGRIGFHLQVFPFTSDQVEMIIQGNHGVGTQTWNTFAIKPKSIQTMLKGYYRKGAT